MATKFDRNVAPDKRMLSIKLRNPLITWTHKSGHLTNKKYLHFHETCRAKPDGMEPKLQDQMFFQSRGFVRSRDK